MFSELLDGLLNCSSGVLLLLRFPVHGFKTTLTQMTEITLRLIAVIFSLAWHSLLGHTATHFTLLLQIPHNLKPNVDADYEFAAHLAMHQK